MNFFKYLKDQWSLILGWLFFVILTAFVMWLAPNITVDWSTIGYLALIQSVFLLVYLLVHYLNKRHWWEKLANLKQTSPLQNYLSGAHAEEEKMIEEYINQLIREHQDVMQEAISNQQDQKDYIDSWVHEIKVPLAATELLLRSIEFDIDDQKYILLENELSKIDEYVEQVLYYARLDSFSRDYLIQEYDLKSIIQPVIRSQANYFIQKNLRYEIVGEDQKILTDAKWVAFIFKQILSNAIKYTPDHKEIVIAIEKNQHGVSLAVQDTGIGIPKEDMARIFDKGFTGTNGRLNKTHATGLGLYLAKSLATKLGIQLTVESVEGEGTTFTLFFPILNFYNEKR
ncbi:two-component system sensor histidine kinase SapS [Enterococcus villorum]|uniref:histidine kinase n=2 Tax=Enterococcus villorum TaxID=112904 RepID=A0A511J247_9ENTE|nr:sensor histidine kinase [Enterococcus villorum]EOH92692.1 two-component system sensor histidine kinase [Enterococcus villorum ATCC 700913]EOW75600.1 two-component system sensor histidine kinase [Enterococcus villorum ATCC 700913]GEL92024.1 two-component sensor histidine kinase [Enterococcus villorum]